MSTIPEIVPLSETISQTAQEGLGVGGQVIAKSEMPEIGHSGDTSHPGQEGLGAGGQVIAKSEMPEIGHSGDTSHPGQEGLGVGGQVIAKSEMPEVGQSDVETSQPALIVYPEMFWWFDFFLRNVEANLRAYALCPISLLVCSSTGFTNRMLCSHAGREWINI
ncbi:unnamed protein product [Sphagnum balticum]